MNYHDVSVKWLEPALLLPQLQEKENSQEAVTLTTNNFAISSMITYNRRSFMFFLRQCLTHYLHRNMLLIS